MAVILMICFPRSGGTILNQCLGSLHNVVILSEVNPVLENNSQRVFLNQTVQEQAKNWYKIELKSTNFFEGIIELEQICASTGNFLIVRDWTFINFTASGDKNAPNKLITFEELSKKCQIIPFAFVRNPIDVWISYKCPNVKDFFPSYLCYIQQLIKYNIPIFKYEEFCLHPERVIQEICRITHLTYSESYKDYKKFHNVNGDIAVWSRGKQQSDIRPLPRQRIKGQKIREVNQCNEMVQANQLLGYPTSYHDMILEKRWTKWFRSISRLLKKLGD